MIERHGLLNPESDSTADWTLKFLLSLDRPLKDESEELMLQSGLSKGAPIIYPINERLLRVIIARVSETRQSAVDSGYLMLTSTISNLAVDATIEEAQLNYAFNPDTGAGATHIKDIDVLPQIQALERAR